MMDDGSASFLIYLFRCGDLAVVGLDLGLADTGINSFDVCLVVDGNFVSDNLTAITVPLIMWNNSRTTIILIIFAKYVVSHK